MRASVKRNVLRLLNRLDMTLLRELLAEVELMRTTGKSSLQAAQLLASGSVKTRETFWEPILYGKRTPWPPMDDHEWELLKHSASSAPARMQARMLETALHHGQVEVAHILIKAGFPCGLRERDNQDGYGDPNSRGAMAHLVYGDYSALSVKQTLELAQAMMDHHGLEAMRAFNPGSVASGPVLEAFLDRAPGPEDVQAWKRDYIWQPHEFARTQATTSSASDPDNIVKLLARGFEGEPVDLLARAIIHGRNDVAHAMLDWDGLTLRRATPPLKTAWDTVTEEPVLAEGFWHALADAWAGVISAQKIVGWNGAPPWPDQALLERLVDLDALDPMQLNEEGLTPAQVAEQNCGQAGPVAAVAPLREQRRLDRSTPQAPAGVRRANRL